MQCTVGDCEKTARVRGFCHKHYRRWLLYGDSSRTKVVQYHGLSMEERFLRHAGPEPDLDDPDACWEWQGYKDKHGYGRLNVNGRAIPTQRIAWELAHGPIPKKMCICHKCDNPTCIREDHLFLGTYKENVRDMHRKGRDRKVPSIGEAHGMSKLTEEQAQEILTSDELGIALAKKFGVTPATISDVRRKKTWTHLPGKKKKKRSCKLTEEQVIAIRISPESASALAKHYGISSRQVYDIKVGIAWKHI